jgi:hypothetical protein
MDIAEADFFMGFLLSDDRPGQLLFLFRPWW